MRLEVIRRSVQSGQGLGDPPGRRLEICRVRPLAAQLRRQHPPARQHLLDGRDVAVAGDAARPGLHRAPRAC